MPQYDLAKLSTLSYDNKMPQNYYKQTSNMENAYKPLNIY